MGKKLSLVLSFLFFFLSLTLCQSCISTDRSLGEGSETNKPESYIKDDSDFIIENDSEIVLNASAREQNQDQDAVLMNAELEDRACAEQSACDKVVLTDEFLQYQTKKNDTLMIIAFNIYGDYRKWRELAALNKNILGAGYDLSHRPVLKYRKPLRAYIAPLGNPYLIKKGDSLSLVSKKVYGSWRKWPLIYRNNAQQIRDPSLIFAGFTLYYPTRSSKKMALHIY